MSSASSTLLSNLLTDKSLFRQECYINGHWVASDKRIEVTNPATGVVIGSIPSLGQKETAEAIKGAEIAQKEWAKTLGNKSKANLKKEKLSKELLIK